MLMTFNLQTVSMFYNYKGKEYLLNLIDTPVNIDASIHSAAINAVFRDMSISATKYQDH